MNRTALSFRSLIIQEPVRHGRQLNGRGTRDEDGKWATRVRRGD